MGEGAGLPAGKGYLKNMQKALNPRPQHQSFLGLSQESSLSQHLCNNKANLLTRLVLCWSRILGTGPRMTGAGDADLVPPVILLLCVLFPKVSFFLPNPAKTC